MARRTSRGINYYYEYTSSEDSDEENQIQFNNKKSQKTAKGQAANLNCDIKKEKVTGSPTWSIAQNLNIPPKYTATNIRNKYFRSLPIKRSPSALARSDASYKRITDFIEKFESDIGITPTRQPAEASTSSVKPAGFCSLSKFKEQSEISVEGKSLGKSPDESSSPLTPSSPKPCTSASMTFIRNLNKPREPAQESEPSTSGLITFVNNPNIPIEEPEQDSFDAYLAYINLRV